MLAEKAAGGCGAVTRDSEQSQGHWPHGINPVVLAWSAHQARDTQTLEGSQVSCITAKGVALSPRRDHSLATQQEFFAHHFTHCVWVRVGLKT